MTSPTRADDAHPYLRAATAGVRHHTHALGRSALPEPADRLHLDVVHAHLTALLGLVDQLAGSARSPHPGAGRHLASAHSRLWQAAAAVHDAFHLLPSPSDSSECRPESLPEGPPFMTICQRHLAAGHIVRRKTTPTDLDRPPHITACLR